MFLRPLIPALLAATAVTALTLTGCSAAALPGSAPTAGSAPASSTAPQSANQSSPTSGGLACPTSAEVASTLGVPKLPAPQRASLDGAVSCVYLSGTGGVVTIETIPSHGAAASKLDAGFKQGTLLGLTFQPVSGIGDSAYSATKNGAISGLYVVKGATELSIAADGSTLPQLEDLAKQILGL